MDCCFDVATNESPHGEAPTRPYSAERLSLSVMINHLDGRSANVLSQLADTFAIHDSGTGIQALLSELKIDLAVLGKIVAVPDWANALEDLRASLVAEFGDNSVRDLASVRSQPKNALRDYLTQLDRKLPPDRQRALRVMRAAVTLKLLAGREQMSASLAEEIKRWLGGKGPASLTLQFTRPHQLCQIRQSFSPDSQTARLVTHLIEALEARLADPFRDHPPSTVTMPVVPTSADADEEDHEGELTSPTRLGPPDPLRGFVAEAGNAGVRIFSGVPTFCGMYPPEIELTVPRIMQQWHGNASDEGLAAFLTLFTRVLPSGFSRLPISASSVAGIWVDVAAGHVCWNLDEVISSHPHEKPFQRSTADRLVRIPLPLEVANDLRIRLAKVVEAQTIDQLFGRDSSSLTKSTKSMLRRLALSSHRPTLKRLSRTWARYILALCQDEAYASAIGVDFTIGTNANFNYVMLRGKRVMEVLEDAYRRIGFSGQLPMEELEDVGSLSLPGIDQVASFVEVALNDVARTIQDLPRRTSKPTIEAVHNYVAVRLYAVLMLLIGGRSLAEETITRSKIDLTTGIGTRTDKRTAPYHERRLVFLAPTMRAWLQVYIGWLQLLAYRMASEDRALSATIATLIDSDLNMDRHPLFFRFSGDDRVIPLGAVDLDAVYGAYGIERNGGRHFLDWLFRSSGFADSAAIMALAGRGNPGQEGFASWSAVVPIEVLESCGNVIECWLGTLSLPSVPRLQPRALPTAVSQKQFPSYIPKLLRSKPESASHNSGRPQEPCPFHDQTATYAEYYAEAFRRWRRGVPPDGWLGVALSLIFEDGVIHEDELGGILRELQHGTLYRHGRESFVDSKAASLGIRRVWISETTVRLLYQVEVGDEAQIAGVNLDQRIDQFMTEVHPDAKGEGLSFLMACGCAFYSLRVPGALFGWMCGLRFARVSRPETVARHLVGAVEPTKFDVRRRFRSKAQSPRLIQRALSRCVKKVRRGSSHASQLSWLGEYLKAIFPDFEEGSHEALVAGYLIHLYLEQKNIFTVARYESGTRGFFEKAAEKIAEQGFFQVDWKALIDSCMRNENEAKLEGPNLTSINHAISWLGLDIRVYRREGPPQSAFRYADFPSIRERDVAVSLLDAQQTTVGDDWDLAATALMLLFEHSHRWDEIAHLRFCDVQLDVEHPHLAIVPESGGNLKTENASRVLFLRDSNLVSRLKEICAQRQLRFPNDPLVPIFGDDDDPRSNVAATRIHDLIGEALRRATGSPVIRIHDTRAGVISRDVSVLMDPDAEGRTSHTLQYRQGMFGISVKAGHAAPDISVENYGHGFDVLRRRWVDKANDSLDSPPSIAFLSRVTGIPAATYRKRISRNGSTTHDIFENFGENVTLSAGAKVVSLSSLVMAGQDHIPWDRGAVREDRVNGAALYVGLRILGESEHDARLAARLTEGTAISLELGMATANRCRPVVIASRDDINRDTFVDEVIDTGLAIAMHTVHPPRAILNRLSAAVPLAGNPWEFAVAEDVLDFKPWFEVLKVNHIEAEVVIRPGASSAVDDYLLGRLRNAGVSRARHISARHFPRGVCALVRFLPHKEKDFSGKARSSPQLAFLVTACALSLLFQTNGD